MRLTDRILHVHCFGAKGACIDGMIDTFYTGDNMVMGIAIREPQVARWGMTLFASAMVLGVFFGTLHDVKGQTDERAEYIRANYTKSEV